LLLIITIEVRSDSPVDDSFIWREPVERDRDTSAITLPAARSMAHPWALRFLTLQPRFRYKAFVSACDERGTQAPP